MTELDRLRAGFARLLVPMLWLHVPLIWLVAEILGRPVLPPMMVAVVLAATTHLAWRKHGIAPATRYVSAVALMGEPALLVWLLAGVGWQMDMHMYFFAALALMMAWCDARAILVAAFAIAAHHLVLNYVMPSAVFAQGADFGRVLLHAGIVAFQTAVLVWLSEMVAGAFGRIEAMQREITQQNENLEIRVEQRTREAEQANAAKSLFLANMSHEIRTPMNAILGFSHLMLRTGLTERQHDYVSKIRAASATLLNLLNDILDFSKIEAGKLALESAPFDPRELVERTMGIAMVRAQEKGLALRWDVDAGLPARLMGDELRLSQVMLNLVSNAVKFTSVGEVALQLRLRERQGSRLVIEGIVRDSGIGMSAEQQARLFESFSQADSSTTRRFGGTGLGLAISRQLVELMQGSIAVESVQGAGSTFTFTLLLAEAEARDAPRGLNPEALRRLRVLIVDDNQASREILHGYFQSWLVGADLVASAREGISALQAAVAEGHPYDLMLLDWKMPGMDGIEAMRAMRAMLPEAQWPAVFMISAYGQDRAMGEAEAVGIAGFLAKPVTASSLLEALQRQFGGQTPDSLPGPKGEAIAGPPMVAPSRRGARVLLVEDNEINMELAVAILGDGGLVVETAENGRIAVNRLLQAGEVFDAVLMDVQMPELDGVAATQEIRAARPGSSLPIIAMTAHAYAAERQRCLEAGMNDHVAKPVDPSALMRTLDRWIRLPLVAGPGGAGTVAAVRAPVVLPDSLPPFDLASALARVNGKSALLHKLIGDFGRKFPDAIPQLRQQAADRKYAEARILAHTLKGVAGSLGLAEVAMRAGEVELVLTTGETPPEALLVALDAALQPALAAAASLGMAAVAAPAAAASFDRAAAAALAGELEDLLARRSLRARRVFEALEAALQGQGGAEIGPLRDALGGLDYAAATLALTALAEKLALVKEKTA
ncbi:response regulator [Roseomonas sp. 18066]|uniref:response regulator n=1 Tax=Roseomonas sp. 18066 TaxID=2681412 RepID=UPI001358CA85|nr:response regulator [Roseomonas sp. 18066]